VNVDGITDILQPDALQGLDRFLDYYAKRLAELDEQRITAAEQQELLKLRCASVSESLAELGGPPKHETHLVTVKLELFSPQEVEFRLVYMVDSCSWTPCYDVRAHPDDPTLSLVYYGSVMQNTGEDWLNAELCLSTAKPALGGAPPKLSPDYLHLGYGHSGKRSGKSGALAAPSDGDGGAITATFTIPRAVNIASDCKPHKVAITLVELHPLLEYKSVPVLSEHAFLRATVLNDTVDGRWW
jgi:uncharacterized protein (TIGR02231 family)